MGVFVPCPWGGRVLGLGRPVLSSRDEIRGGPAGPFRVDTVSVLPSPSPSPAPPQEATSSAGPLGAPTTYPPCVLHPAPAAIPTPTVCQAAPGWPCRSACLDALSPESKTGPCLLPLLPRHGRTKGPVSTQPTTAGLCTVLTRPKRSQCGRPGATHFPWLAGVVTNSGAGPGDSWEQGVSQPGLSLAQPGCLLPPLRVCVHVGDAFWLLAVHGCSSHL